LIPFFFFQAEDGIRAFHVTGVQTCALPIFPLILEEVENKKFDKYVFKVKSQSALSKNILVPRYYWQNKIKEIENIAEKQNLKLRSEERRVGKEGRYQWRREH